MQLAGYVSMVLWIWFAVRYCCQEYGMKIIKNHTQSIDFIIIWELGERKSWKVMKKGKRKIWWDWSKNWEGGKQKNDVKKSELESIDFFPPARPQKRKNSHRDCILCFSATKKQICMPKKCKWYFAWLVLMGHSFQVSTCAMMNNPIKGETISNYFVWLFH